MKESEKTPLTLLRRYWFNAWAAALLLLIPLSLLPQTAPPGTPLLGDLLSADKVLHFLVYGSMAVPPLVFSYDRRRGQWLVVVVVTHSLMMEVLQTAIPGRSGSLSDIIANLAGILMAVAITPVLKNYQTER